MSKNDITTIATNDVSQLTLLIKLDLSENKIKSIGSNAFSNLILLEELILRKNRLRTLQAGSFAGLSNLLTLNIQQNYLKSVDDAALTMPKLEVLILNSNDLPSLPNITRLTNVRNVLLDSNEIVTVPDGAFANTYPQIISFSFNSVANLSKLGENCKNLKTLKLVYNKLTFLPEDFFTGCRVLSYVQLNNNKLESLDWMQSLGDSLTQIYVSKNKISGAISSEPFTNLSQMTMFALQNNKITTFDVKAFRHLMKTRTLDLGENNLTSFDNPYSWCQTDRYVFIHPAIVGETGVKSLMY